MENRLLTIMFLDVQGYTRRTAQATREETSRFVEEMRAFVQAHLEKFQGRLVKTMGDGFLASFESPTNAVQCGLAMQRQIRLKNATLPNPNQYTIFRIGINTGEVSIDEQGDLFGDPVNIAARIESFAESGEVFISEATYLAMNRNEVGTVDLGPQSFKNATREIRVYKILDGQAARPGGKGQSGKPQPASAQVDSWRKSPWVWAGAGVLATLIAVGAFLALRRGLSRPPPNPPRPPAAGSMPNLPPVVSEPRPSRPEPEPPRRPEPPRQDPGHVSPAGPDPAPLPTASTRTPNGGEGNNANSSKGPGEGRPAFADLERPAILQEEIRKIQEATNAGDFQTAARLVQETLRAGLQRQFTFDARDLGMMAWILSQNGDLRAAEKVLELAIQRASGDERLQEYLKKRMGDLRAGQPRPFQPGKWLRGRLGGGGNREPRPGGQKDPGSSLSPRHFPGARKTLSQPD
ncbi:MAG: hypothetical protein GX442_03380 [Candidatus Riflebacteria bacterium]|nr:hypothetical protein [Candidatus Riflebacteria bacterium]